MNRHCEPGGRNKRRSIRRSPFGEAICSGMPSLRGINRYAMCVGIPKQSVYLWLMVCFYRLLRSFAQSHACARNDVVRIPPISLFAIIPLFLLPLSSQATIHTVKQDGTGNFSTIQAGINAAATGDTVLVWPGIYFENIDYLSKNITVASLYFTTGIQNYINTTIIDGANNGSCVYISPIVGDDATLCGFTIQHGSGNSSFLYSGGGILIISSTIAISHCIIQDNHCLIGGGITCYLSDVHLSGTVVKNNTALIQAGGIIISNDCDFIFDTIQKNSVYLNYGPRGCDISKTISLEEQHIVLDTATVLLPDRYFFYSHDINGNPLNNLTWEIDHEKIEQVNADLYVSVNGNNINSGLTPSDPLKTIAFAMSKIVSDSINPKIIHIGSGTFSHATGEIFPVYPRNFTSLAGSGVENTIIDADLTYPLYTTEGRMKCISINDISFIKGNDNNNYTLGLYGGFEIVHSENVRLQNISISETIGYLSSAFTSRASEINIYGLSVFDNSGGFPVVISNTSELYRKIHIVNSFIYCNGPGGDNWGGGLLIGGSYSNPENNSTKLINVQINENIKTFDPGAGNFGTSGLNCVDYAKVDVINTTIANNIVTNPVPGGQVYATEGAKINFYNSIVYGTEDYEIFLGDGTSTSDIATVNISNTDVKGGEANIQNWNNIHILNWLDGNIDEDPLWEGGEPFSYAIQPGSPCIDAGVPMYEAGMDYPYIKEENGKYILYMLEGDTVTLPATDLAGNPRISGGRIDMGAYEWQDTATGIKQFQDSDFKFQVYPNPFRSNVFISFSTEKEQMIELEVIDMNGQMVKTITSGRFPAGYYRLVWDGKDEDGFEVKAGNYVVYLHLNAKLVSREKLIKQT